MERLCAVYDATPSQPQPMMLDTCQSRWNPSSAPNLSQKFRYDASTGEITPIWAAVRNNNATEAQPGQNTTMSSNDGLNGMATNSTQSNSTSFITREVQAPQSVERVALIFAPSVPEYSSVDDSESGPSDPSGSLMAGTPTASSAPTPSQTDTSRTTVSSVATPGPSTSSANTTMSDAAATQATSSGALEVEVATRSTTSTTSTMTSIGTATPSPPSADQIAADIADNEVRL